MIRPLYYHMEFIYLLHLTILTPLIRNQGIDLSYLGSQIRKNMQDLQVLIY